MITECPICGGRLQATAKSWFDHATLNEDFTVNSIGEYCGYDDHQVKTYCENDHSLFEMMAHAHVEKQNGIQ